jgi:hypothetical protein
MRIAFARAEAARADWWPRESGLLLPVEYHHVVFTLPAELAELVLVNRAVCGGGVPIAAGSG